jgi:phosphotransferase system enzyme I (PtsI)
MAETWLRGRVASTGIAVGPAFPLMMPTAVPHDKMRASAGPMEEEAALRAAISGAITDLADLMAMASAEAGAILEFQIAMLEDDSLSDVAFAEISAGCAAAIAWRQAMDAQIADYEASNDDYFRARVADLSDMRDRVLQQLNGESSVAIPPGSVLIGDDLTPSLFLSQDWGRGGAIVLRKGSPSSHVAMLARMRRVPMIVGLGSELPAIGPGTTVIVDAQDGGVAIAPDAGTLAAAENRRRDAEADLAAAEAGRFKAARTADGTDIKVLINVAGLADVEGLDSSVCDGIGLVRTEFLFRQDGDLPNEEEQYAVYRQITDWAQQRPVTIRTLDAGGDKPIAGLTVPGEGNPFLGLRGLRLSLVRPDVFRVQLRALCRAAVAGNLKIMLPMVTVPSEVEAARHLLDEVVTELQAAGIACARPPLGIMVEVPAAALTPERFAADFFSIGSNDLTQYTLAAARDLDSVAGLGDAGDPAVLKLIAITTAFGRAAGREVSLCGDAGADPRLVPALLTAGLRSLSVAPSAVGRVKAAIATTRLA